MSAAMEQAPDEAHCVCGCGATFRPLRLRSGDVLVGECIGAMRLRRAMEPAASEDWKADRRAKPSEPTTPRTYKPKVRPVVPDGYGSKRQQLREVGETHGQVTIGLLRQSFGWTPAQASNAIVTAHRDDVLERVRPGVYRLAGGC